MLSVTAVLITVGLAILVFAAFIHVVIFYLESVAWSRPATWKRFGLSSQIDANVVRPMAFNQGFYNLFLAIGVVAGVVIALVGNRDAGIGIAVFAALSMLAAAIVLILSSPSLARAALVQGAAPLVGSVLVIVGVALAD